MTTTFCLHITPLNQVVTLDGNELIDGCQTSICESQKHESFYQVRIENGFLELDNSCFGFEKIYFQKKNSSFVITNDVSLLDVNGFVSEGIASILTFGYLLPTLTLYEGINVLPVRATLKLNLATLSYDILDKGINSPSSVERSTVKSVESFLKLNNVDCSSFLMSGGRDSRVIAALNPSDVKKTFTFMLEGFKPDIDDLNNVLSYNNSIIGNHKVIRADTKDKTLCDSYKTSTIEAFDHVHAGRWKFDYFIKNVSSENERLTFVNGQTADTIICLNLTGNDVVSRIRRAAFYGKYSHRAVKFLLKQLSPVLGMFPNKYQMYFQGLSQAKNDAEYYAGYILNDIEFPGIERSKQKRLYKILGSAAMENLYAKTKRFVDGKISLYGSGETHAFMLDLCLSTFIWGMDMRGLREACHRYGHSTNFLFMNNELIRNLLSLPAKYTSPLSQYKRVLSDIERKYKKSIFKDNPTQTSIPLAEQSFEKLIIDGCIGDYWKEQFSTKEFEEFVKYILHQHQIDLSGIEISTTNYTLVDRTMSLFLWYKKYIKSC
ncbi:hypothetical protein C2869_10090 [Saccharobesus litoralis]|uniref:Asparagine synthetase domain-containing protein n=1 Tax=Saccharobesus litoralis TaxID=2172099 RepID=A0A2S0VRE2_9ALTE|nr:hypothetical protein [Saccharobesus litoralis]AWB66752.1 hypothetical protein C2869_10090 [Saccharobesus litoralis]